ncbi:hypothetical protein Goklo_007543 [Gossypium klotzschianum]|uniref:RNase H type-1 domain-containing protein n=1 Tax=Gossypium klotzschianum TaxID=34286 RepID=A0A7J8UX85_9ROSI|nr:hypothetical protein [Gossypium klotzschianum]
MVHDNIPSGFAAEATACLQAVTVGRDLGMKYVKIEGDSLTVIKKAQNRDKSAIGPYIHDVRNLSEVFYECKFQHARRIANESAHCLASEGLKIGKNEYLVYGTAGQDITEVYTENKFQKVMVYEKILNQFLSVCLSSLGVVLLRPSAMT